MENMRFKVGDRVRIKNLDWYNKNKDEYGYVNCGSRAFFTKMSDWCGKIATIKEICKTNCYRLEEYDFDWTDEMIEGLVEEENKPKFKVGDEVRIKGTDIGGTIESVIRGQLIVNSKGSKIPAWPEDVVLMKSVEEETKPNIIKEAKTYWDSIKDAWICPEGYIFKDENGNEILTSKIILEKKKKEYPKTYEECLVITPYDKEERILYLLEKFKQLLIARDAYWKIAGEEMGLGKPWKLSIGTPIYYIYYNRTVGTIKNDYADDIQGNIILAFPTKEMRDAFKENFDKDLEICKELL